MGNALEKICEDKRAHVASRMAARSLSEVRDATAAASPPRGFADRLRRHLGEDRYGLISEIKRASPSKGLIREDFNPETLARDYARGGASCLSVLTDIPYFQGDDAHLAQARNAVDLPVLRKDFMIDPYQIAESRALGADCVLLIMAALEDGLAAEMEDLARSYGMDVLIEVHNEAELDRALRLESPLMGINNRDLTTLKTDIGTTRRLAHKVPPDRILISESGLYTPADLASMADAGARCFLIGESLMRADDVAEAVRSLLVKAEANVV